MAGVLVPALAGGLLQSAYVVVTGQAGNRPIAQSFVAGAAPALLKGASKAIGNAAANYLEGDPNLDASASESESIDSSAESSHEDDPMSGRADTVVKESPSKRSRATMESGMSSREALTESDQTDGYAGNTSDVRVNAPAWKPVPERPVTMVYRKKNRFFIDVTNYKNVHETFDSVAGKTSALMHCVPWKTNAMYMNPDEIHDLHLKSKMYRYKECAFRFSNVTVHTGNLAGSSDPHINLSYNGILCFSGTTSRHDVGPTMIVEDGGLTAKHRTVQADFSNTNRNLFYRPWQFNIAAVPTVDSYLYNTESSPTVHSFRIRLPNLLDRMSTKSGSLPVSEFHYEMVPRWRNSKGSGAPSAITARKENHVALELVQVGGGWTEKDANSFTGIFTSNSRRIFFYRRRTAQHSRVRHVRQHRTAAQSPDEHLRRRSTTEH